MFNQKKLLLLSVLAASQFAFGANWDGHKGKLTQDKNGLMTMQYGAKTWSAVLGSEEVPANFVGETIVTFEYRFLNDMKNAGIHGGIHFAANGKRVEPAAPTAGCTIPFTKNWKKIEFRAFTPQDAVSVGITIAARDAAKVEFRNIKIEFIPAVKKMLIPQADLATPAKWWIHKLKFTPAANGKPALLDLPKGYSALIRTFAVDPDNAGTVKLHVKARLLTPSAQLNHTAYSVTFFDKKKKVLKTNPRGEFPIDRSGKEKEQTWTIPIPKGACSADVRISSHGTGKLELSAYDFEFIPADNGKVSSVTLFDRKDLLYRHKWNFHRSVFTPLTPKTNAFVEFPAGDYCAMMRDFAIAPKCGGELVMNLRYRVVGDFKNFKYTSVGIGFRNKERKNIPFPKGVKDGVALTRNDHNWHRVVLRFKIPDDAAFVCFHLGSHGGGKLEISDLSCLISGKNISQLAINGFHFENIVLAKASAGKPTADYAEAEVFDKVPFAFDQAFWSARPRYVIPATQHNKIARSANDSQAFFRMAADRENLYVYYQAQDDRVNFKFQHRYERDCFEFFFRPVGTYGASKSSVRHEQYFVTRTENGETDSNSQALTRLVPGGWEALLKIPLQNTKRRIYPFNGLELTFNASYQDADTVAQEHWMSFSSKDKRSTSWSDPDLYVPLRFVTKLPLAYKPLWLGDTAEYNVAPTYAGRINMTDLPAKIENLSFWGMPSVDVSVTKENAYRVSVHKACESYVSLQHSCFSVLPGETIEVELEARSDKGDVRAITLGILSQADWAVTGIRRVSGPGNMPKTWTKFRYRGVIPQKIRENKRAGRFLVNAVAPAGSAYEFRNIKVTHRTPADFDAMLTLDKLYTRWKQNEEKTFRVILDSPKAVDAVFEISLLDFYTGKKVAGFTQKGKVPAGRSDKKFTLPKNIPLGFFNLKVRIFDTKKEFLAHREIYVANFRPAEKQLKANAVFIHNLRPHAPPIRIDEMAEICREMGVGMVSFIGFDIFDRHDEVATYPLYQHLPEFKKRNIEITKCISRGNDNYAGHSHHEVATAKKFWARKIPMIGKNIITTYHFANEPNLWCDAREWASYQPAFYNAIKKMDPNAKVVLANFSGIPEDYLRQVKDQIGCSFADGIIGVHLYGFEFNARGCETLMKNRQFFEKLYPGWEVRDMESGAVHHTFRDLTEMLTKKTPMHLTCGIMRTSFYHDNDLFMPLADATPALPLLSQLTKFYLDAVPVGRVQLAGGVVHAYCFRTPDGKGRVALWNTQAGKVTFALPGGENAVRYDQFGNRIAKSAKITLSDVFVNYFENVDLAKLTKAGKFLPAFKGAPKPFIDRTYLTDVYVTPCHIYANSGYDFTLVAGQDRRIDYDYSNESAKPVQVTPSVKTPAGVTGTFEPKSFTLKPGETRKSTLILRSNAAFKQGFASIGGNASTGKISPRKITLSAAPPIEVVGGSRTVFVRNNSGKVSPIKIEMELNTYFATPLNIAKAEPGKGIYVPFSTQLRASNGGGRPRLINQNEPYVLRVTSPAGNFKATGTMYGFMPENQPSSDFNFLRYQKRSGALAISYQMVSVPRRRAIRLVMRVEDTTPVQERDGGWIKKGGDAVIVAFENKGLYREYGFSAVPGKTASYVWDGTYGMENTKAAPAGMISTLRRDGKYMLLDVTFPLDQFPAGSGMSILVIDKAGKSVNRIELGKGIEPRNPAEMGLLLK